MSTKAAEPTKEESPVSGLREYLEGVRKELRLAEWPSRPELIRLTQVVLTLIAIVAVYCGGLDWLLSLLTTRLFNR